MSECFVESLVSIVTPCFNGEQFIDRYFEGIISQTYRPLEVIFVDDGSTDNTFAKAFSYTEALNKQGITLVCLQQEHLGQAAAINYGITKVHGEFITWPDSDDVMYPNNILKKVEYLNSHLDYGFVCCQVNRVNDNDLNKVLMVDKVDDPSNPWIFDGLIRDKGVYCLDIAYLVRSEALFNSLDGRRIVESRAGQNLQLLLPLAYRYKCGFIDEPLVAYVARKESHSRSFSTYEEQIERTHDFEILLHKVIRSISMKAEDQEKYERYIDTKFVPKRFYLAVEFGKAKDIRSAKQEVDLLFGKSFINEVLAYIGKLRLGKCFFTYVPTLIRLKKRLTKLKRSVLSLRKSRRVSFEESKQEKFFEPNQDRQISTKRINK